MGLRHLSRFDRLCPAFKQLSWESFLMRQAPLRPQAGHAAAAPTGLGLRQAPAQRSLTASGSTANDKPVGSEQGVAPGCGVRKGGNHGLKHPALLRSSLSLTGWLQHLSPLSVPGRKASVPLRGGRAKWSAQSCTQLIKRLTQSSLVCFRLPTRPSALASPCQLGLSLLGRGLVHAGPSPVPGHCAGSAPPAPPPPGFCAGSAPPLPSPRPPGMRRSP